MHLCLFISGLQGGGAERVATTLARTWVGDSRVSRMSLVTGAVGGEPADPLPKSIELLRLPLQGESQTVLEAFTANVDRVRLLRGALNRLRPDAIIAFMDEMAVLVTLAALGTGIPVIAALRADPSGPNLRTLWRKLRVPIYCNLSDAVVVQTQAGLKQSARLFPGAKIYSISNPLPDLPRAPMMSERGAIIASAGRLIPSKGFDLLIDAFARSSWREGQWRLRIHGEGPERPRLKAKIVELGLEGFVDLPGFDTNVLDRLGEAAIFAFPSRSEGFPNALLEAAAMGCACVSTDCNTGPQEILETGRLGLLVPVDDREALTSALNRLMADATLREEMNGNLQRFRKQYDKAVIAGHWLDLACQFASSAKHQ
jgi:GalNAc-alpha-(1->4)-GalNAc-alpha-(1->3)-diNAcBac-PP-undecaprenol alpha-1,4-N-acetyl-D-galactosaminyltransferase